MTVLIISLLLRNVDEFIFNDPAYVAPVAGTTPL